MRHNWISIVLRTAHPLSNNRSLFRILRTPSFANHKVKVVNSDWLADQWDGRSVLGHTQFHKGRVKDDYAEIDTAQIPKHFERRLTPLEQIRKTFIDSIPNKSRIKCELGFQFFYFKFLCV